jgi:hypothetical protein
VFPALRVALRYAFSAFDQFPLYQYRGSQPFANQPQCNRAFNLVVQQLHQLTVINFIKEVFQVDVNNVLIPFIDVSLRLLYCLLGVAIV